MNTANLETTLKQLHLSGLCQTLGVRLQEAADFHTLKPLQDFDWSFNPSVHKKEILIWPAASSSAKPRMFCSSVRPASAKPIWPRPSVTMAIKMNFQVLYRSIFDLVRDFLKDEAFNQQERTVRKYLKPDMVIIDDMGLKQLRNHSGEYLRVKEAPGISPENKKNRKSNEPATAVTAS
jgi:hypothetical protein